MLLVFLLLGGVANAQKAKFKPKYVSGVFMVKLKPEDRSFFITRNGQQSWWNISGNYMLSPTFKFALELTNKEISSTNKVDLTLIYTVKVKSAMHASVAQNELESLGVFEYVEPKKISEIVYTPNDPKINQQNYLAQINVYSAWDVTHGNVALKIGVVDTGTDMDHPDLQSEMTENVADPINGIDDDGDGYIDNFNGWDFIDNDNEPQAVANPHGIHVAGIAAAATHNSEGVASVGFNTQFMPIRVADGSAVIYGYEGIIYAADMGCDIINCSWGSFGYSKFEEDIINYATFNKDALVVAAAGNDSKEEAFYPAAYENCLAVSSVNSLDGKSGFSNYGYWVDIASTGEGIYSTWKDGLYNLNSGTSMAAPVVSAAAALVKDKFPQLSALQIAERLKSTSVDISGLNVPYQNKLGDGRLDVGAAVSGAITEASVVFGNVKITNKFDDVFKIGDSILISGTFTNYLALSGNVTATITTSSPYLVLNKGSYNLGVMGSALQIDNYSSPFSYKILSTAPLNEKIVFEVTVTDGVFTNKYFEELLVNVDYLNINVNNLAITVGSKGQLGYNGRSKKQGVGLSYKNGVSQVYEMGLMIGTNTAGFAQVVDRIRSSTSTWDDEFVSVQNVKQIAIPLTDYAVQGVFNDSNAHIDSLGLIIKHTGYANSQTGHKNYVVFEYEVKNVSGIDINNLSIGLFADFDVANYEQNKANTDWIKFTTYTQSATNGHPLFGVQLLTAGIFRSYCIDHVSGGNGGIDITSGYTSNKKYTSLNSNRYQAGLGSSLGNDVVQVTSMANINLLDGDSIKVAFAVHAVDDFYMLQQSADSAYFKYNGMLPSSIHKIGIENTKLKVYPNPAQNVVTIDVTDAKFKGKWEFTIFDVALKTVYQSPMISGSSTFELNIYNFRAGIYVVEVQLGKDVFVTKLIKNQ